MRIIRVSLDKAHNVPAEPSSCLDRNCTAIAGDDCDTDCVFAGGAGGRTDELKKERQRQPKLLFLVPADRFPPGRHDDLRGALEVASPYRGTRVLLELVLRERIKL